MSRPLRRKRSNTSFMWDRASVLVGVGEDLYRQFELLKQKPEAEGLCPFERVSVRPAFPVRIGARHLAERRRFFQDVINVLRSPLSTG